MEMMSKQNINNEFRFYKLKLAKKRLLISFYLILIGVITYFSISNKFFFPGLNLLIALNFILLISPMKKVLSEIRTIKLCILLLGFCIDEKKDKNIDPEISELFKK